MKKENCYFGYQPKYSMRPENWPRHLRTVSDKIQHVIFTSMDFENVLKILPNGSFLFVDPPHFYADQKKFYSHCFEKSDHERLCKLLYEHRKKFRFVITYDDSAEIREAYNWCSLVCNEEWQYTVARTDDQKQGLKSDDGYKSKRSNALELILANFRLDN